MMCTLPWQSDDIESFCTGGDEAQGNLLGALS